MSSVLDTNEHAIQLRTVGLHWQERCWSLNVLSRSGMISRGKACVSKAVFCSQHSMSDRFTALSYVYWTFYSYSLLPAISLDGMVDCMVVEGAFNTRLFVNFIFDLLDKMNPFPASRFVIIMNNCVIHKAPEIRELIEFRSVLSLRIASYCSELCLEVSGWSICHLTRSTSIQ